MPSNDEKLVEFLKEFQELAERHNEIKVFMYAVGPIEHGISGNACHACMAGQVMGLLLSGRISHKVEEGMPTNLMQQKANMN